MNYAIVKNGVVVNMIVWDGKATWDDHDSGTMAVPVPAGAYVGIGSTYDGTTFGIPPQPDSEMP